MMGPERRQYPRTNGGQLAYINIEPSNAGILLNLSEGGLCFHSIAPVLQNSTLRLCFSEHNKRIELEGEVAWTNETHKTVGMRFCSLTADAQEQVRKWIEDSANHTAREAFSPALPMLRSSPPLTSSAEEDLEQQEVPRSAILPGVKIVARLSGFSVGVLTGILVSTLVTGAVFLYAYRRDFGESLIRLGQVLAAKPVVKTPSPIPVSAPAADSSDQPISLAPPTNSDKPQPSLAPALPETSVWPVSNGDPIAKNTANNDADNTPEPPVILSANNLSGPSAHITVLEKATNLPELEHRNEPAPVAPSGVTTVSEESVNEKLATPAQMYSEIGKFKDAGGARAVVQNVEQLGLPASVTQKGHLWTSAYYVLVGPYSDRTQAETAHQTLVSNGFKPQAFEKGSRDFHFGSSLDLNGSQVPVGYCTVAWESYSTHAAVKFLQEELVVAKADGTWIKTAAIYDRSAIVYRRNTDGSRTLLELRFAGMNRALVFRNPSEKPL